MYLGRVQVLRDWICNKYATTAYVQPIHVFFRASLRARTSLAAVSKSIQWTVAFCLCYLSCYRRLRRILSLSKKKFIVIIVVRHTFPLGVVRIHQSHPRSRLYTMHARAENTTTTTPTTQRRAFISDSPANSQPGVHSTRPLDLLCGTDPVTFPFALYPSVF